MTPLETRDLSAAIFGNEKFVEVVLILEANAPGETSYAAAIARQLKANNDLVMDVLLRLQKAGLVKGHPRIGNPRRGTIPWEVQPGPLWDAVVAACRLVAV